MVPECARRRTRVGAWYRRTACRRVISLPKWRAEGDSNSCPPRLVVRGRMRMSALRLSRIAAQKPRFGDTGDVERAVAFFDKVKHRRRMAKTSPGALSQESRSAQRHQEKGS